jgi:O-methyltransferase domain/Dimerisation domain
MQSPGVTPDHILGLGSAFKAAKTLLSAVELGVFTALAKGPLAGDALKIQIGIAERGARDFFDALVALGLLQRDEGGRYFNTPETDFYLDRVKPSYIGADLDHLNARAFPLWDSLTAALRMGTPQSAAAGDSFYEPLYSNQAALDGFAQGMTGGSLLAAQALAVRFPWHHHRTLVDIGTAQGCLPVHIAQVHPHLTGGGFDLPALQPLFDGYVRKHGLSDRLRFCAGNFFTDQLPAADVIVLGRVLHNWDLATKKMLLRKAYDALSSRGAVIVYERLIDDERRVDIAGLLASLAMVVATTGGFNFTGADCVGWMGEAGFRDMVVGPLANDMSMIVGHK